MLLSVRRVLWPFVILMTVAAVTVSCGGALSGGTISTTKPLPAPPSYFFGIVACADSVPATAPCPHPIVGATVSVHHSDGYVSSTTNGDGYVLMNATIPFSDIKIVADGFLPFALSIQPPLIDKTNITCSLTRSVPPMPAPPTRAEILKLQITFQGLTVQTQQFGSLPWFEAALPWLTPEDRQAVYAAKHSSTAWAGGDSHAIIQLPSGSPLYDEAGQPYSADRFPALDWTATGDTRLADLIAEVARAGFNKQLLFLGGDDGSTCAQVPAPPQCGYVIAMAQLDIVHTMLLNSSYGDLRDFVVVLPGWDGVFYGYTPDQVAAFGAKCRALFVYCGIEHQPGRVPTGEGGGDFLPGGKMSTYDLILAEFNGPNDTPWRQTQLSSPVDYNGNQIWQIGARMLGPVYTKPSDQPANADEASPPWYLSVQSPRGPYVHCSFEWVGEYLWVRSQETAANVARDRAYFKSAGWSCGG